MGSWAYVVIDDSNKIIKQDSGIVYDTTSNRMEYTAFIKGANYIASNSIISNELIIAFTDSELLVNTFNSWMHKWKLKEWTRKGKSPIKNLDLVKELYEIDLKNKNLRLSHIPGHQGYEWNEHCDNVCSDLLYWEVKNNPDYKPFTYHHTLQSY